MKVFVTSFMLLGLLKVVTSDCETEGKDVLNCLENLDNVPEYRDDFLLSLSTQDEKQAFACCVLDDLDVCIRRHLVGNCAHVADVASRYGRQMFETAVRDLVEPVPCTEDLKNACSALRSKALLSNVAD
ncbi:uncharacterized protein LOC135400061 [Ornithodoros turicata]|uniref:uncharacterized protein LOC135400061 n=1 Tax=Ornithodoros turicata TaxID=34597 RepID=UPI003138CFD3